LEQEIRLNGEHQNHLLYLSEQKSLSKNFRDESSIKSKSEGNRNQFKFNEEIQKDVQ